MSATEITPRISSGLHSIPETAQRLPISVSALQKHVARGNVEAVRLGKRIYIREDEIDRIRREGLPSLR